jgi:uncharacterized protein
VSIELELARSLARAAAAAIDASRRRIDDLNVYPVPDGDTGTNLHLTVAAAAEALTDRAFVGDDTETPTPARLMTALAHGALMGARGNSGVITSQILRGLAEGLAGKTRFNALDLANALDLGTKAAYGAVAKPVEGTILTVIREASAAAVASAEKERTIDAVMGATTTAARKAVAKTPSLLAILREAGVVDSGGQGLFRLFEGAHRFLTGEAEVAARLPGVVGVTPAGGASAREHGAPPGAGMRHEGFGFETMFLAQAEPGKALDVNAIRAHFESIGESVLVAGDARAIKVHIHNERPDQVLAYALGLGQLSKITVENLDQQTNDVRETRAAAFAGEEARAPGRDSEGGTDARDAAPRDAQTDGHRAAESTVETIPLAVVAVAAGEGLAAIFRDFGVQKVVYGGQSANPSTGELLEAVRSVDAREILVLPNNPNVVLAARQVTSLVDRPVAVVATRNAAEGFAAMLALDPDKSAAANAEEMTAAGRAIQSIVVTQAVRDATVSGKKVKEGQTIALDPDDGLVAVHNDPATAVLNAVKKLNPGFELITVYYGDGGDLAGTEALARRIHELGTGAEVEVLHGGQPHYRYLISAE